jgi:hypothetical protein
MNPNFYAHFQLGSNVSEIRQNCSPETVRSLLGKLVLHQEDNASGSSISVAVDNTLLQLQDI